MTLEQAIKILHPDTRLAALVEVEYYAGFRADEKVMIACRDACLLACEAMQREVERQNKQSDCDWCEDNAFDLIHGNDFFGEIEEGNLCAYYYGTGEEIKSVPRKINYCPMCGKPLNDGKAYVSKLVLETLDEVGIPYEHGKGEFVFNGLSRDDFLNNGKVDGDE